MKNLKIKFELFSLLAVLAVSIFLTACEQTEIVSSNTYQEQTALNSNNTRYVLPKGIEENEEDIFTYLQDISEETSLKLAENFRIASFLAEENIFKAIWEDMNYGQHLSDINLVNYLTENQLVTLKHYSPNLEARSGETCRISNCRVKSQYNGSWCNYTCYKVCFDGNGTMLYIENDYRYVGRC